MNASDDNWDLLFGLVAFQLGLIDRTQLADAFAAWSFEVDLSLADHLVAQGELDAEQRMGVETMVALHLKKHGGNVERSLAAIPVGRSVREALAEAVGPDIAASLPPIGPRPDETPENEQTGTDSVGAPASDDLRFRILRHLGDDGLGKVFAALDTAFNREVALKQIRAGYDNNRRGRQYFLREAEITGGLEHPGIVPVYYLGTDGDGRPFYTMRLIKGDNLKTAIDHFHGDKGARRDPARRSLELRKLLRRFLDVCNTIDYAHSRGVLHQDIKPARIILGPRGETLVLDWRLAIATGKADPSCGERALVPNSASGISETQPTGRVVGTPAYMSPEQAQGNSDAIGARSDIYNLGATLYCLLTGRPPVNGDTIGSVLSKVQRGEFPRPRQVDPTIDRAIEAVCLKAMALRPEDRYSSCPALADDVERWMADEPVTAWREPTSRRARRWVRRNRAAVTAAAAAVLAAVLVALAGTAAVLKAQTQANSQLKAANADLSYIANLRATEANTRLEAANHALGEANAALARSENSREQAEAFITLLLEPFLIPGTSQ